MESRFSVLVRWAAVFAAATSLFAGCGKKAEPVPVVEKKEVVKSASGPSVAEVKAIAEEAFIYGLPLVMNYAVMYEYAVNKGGKEYKAPFNEIKNEARVFTYKDTAIITPNSDTPYSFLWLDLRAEPMVISVPAVDKKRYYSVQLIDGNTYNFGYIGSRATGNEPGELPGRRPRLERRDARPGSRRFSLRPPRSRSPLTGPSCSIPRTCPTS